MKEGDAIKNKVQNPLTIIAIFAGIAEVAGTAVLLGLPIELQVKFVWFVMLFPVMLVTAFFLVLIFRPNVLYAPGDFSDEKNYMELQRSRLKDASKIVEELKAGAQSEVENVSSNKEQILVSIDKINSLSEVLGQLQIASSMAAEDSEKPRRYYVMDQLLLMIKNAGENGVNISQIVTGARTKKLFKIVKEILDELEYLGKIRRVDDRVYYKYIDE